MHNAKVTTSSRLQRVLKLLKSGKTYTTRDIIRKAHVCAINSIVSELRANGFNIHCRRSGQKWFYQLGESHGT